ncbi:MAG: hypothetical protein ACYCYM_07515 [Saccharofermentanales bacterium]
MIGINDLHDMSAIFTGIREDIKNDKNEIIIQKIIQVLFMKDTYEYNQLRNTLKDIDGLDKEKWNFVFHENLYVYNAILHDDNIYVILTKICEKLRNAILQNKFDEAEDLTNAVHCLPDIIAENHLTITANYWNSHMKYYRDKWDKDFLKNEEKSYNKRFKHKWINSF